MFGMVSVIFLSALSGCDRNADALIPNESDKFPAVIEIGELEVVDKNTLNFIVDKQQGTLAYIKPNLDADTGDVPADSKVPDVSASLPTLTVSSSAPSLGSGITSWLSLPAMTRMKMPGPRLSHHRQPTHAPSTAAPVPVVRPVVRAPIDHALPN